MVSTVLRSGFIREDLIESHVVPVDSVARRPADNQVRWIPQIADEDSDRNVGHVIPKSATIGPTARNETTVFEGILNLALQDIAAKHTQSGEACVVGVCRIARTVSSKARARSREIHFDEIRNEDRCDVGTPGFDAGNIGIKYEKVQQLCKFGVFRVTS